MSGAKRSALVTGADRGLGLALCKALLERGWRVFAGQYMPDWPELGRLAEEHAEQLFAIPLDVADTGSVRNAAAQVGNRTDRLDMLINNAGVTSPAMHRTIREPQDYDEAHRLYDVNALGPMRVVEAFLPLMDAGEMKRLCFVSSEAGSIGRCGRDSWYPYCTSKAALNMAVRIMFNHLRPGGYTFRLRHPGWMRTYMSGQKNLKANLEPEEAARLALAHFLGPQDEDRLVMRDHEGNEWPW
jgi:NAD(P)-dependent dehydrogenase (short-subunit alcohol dehydrogenase family)